MSAYLRFSSAPGFAACCCVTKYLWACHSAQRLLRLSHSNSEKKIKAIFSGSSPVIKKSYISLRRYLPSPCGHPASSRESPVHHLNPNRSRSRRPALAGSPFWSTFAHWSIRNWATVVQWCSVRSVSIGRWYIWVETPLTRVCFITTRSCKHCYYICSITKPEHANMFMKLFLAPYFTFIWSAVHFLVEKKQKLTDWKQVCTVINSCVDGFQRTSKQSMKICIFVIVGNSHQVPRRCLQVYLTFHKLYQPTFCVWGISVALVPCIAVSAAKFRSSTDIDERAQFLSRAKAILDGSGFEFDSTQWLCLLWRRTSTEPPNNTQTNIKNTVNWTQNYWKLD